MSIDSAPKIAAIVEARLGSTRLPGKHLIDVFGQPMIWYLVRQLEASKLLDDIIVATTTSRVDDPLVAYLQSISVCVYRGSEEDVLGRVLEAAQAYDVDVLVEVTGDCVLVDPLILDYVVTSFLNYGDDYNLVTNCLSGTYPIGMDSQVFSRRDLSRVESLANAPLDREHVTRYFLRNPDKFRTLSVATPRQWYWPGLSIVLDEPEDALFIKRIIEYLGVNTHPYSCEQIFELLKRTPELLKIAQHVHRKSADE